MFLSGNWNFGTRASPRDSLAQFRNADEVSLADEASLAAPKSVRESLEAARETAPDIYARGDAAHNHDTRHLVRERRLLSRRTRSSAAHVDSRAAAVL